MKPKHLILGTVLAVLFFSNPQEEQYIKALSLKSEEAICKWEGLSFLKTFCHLFARPIVNHNRITSTLKTYSHRQNMLIFSIHTTDLGVVKIQAIGVANHCFFLPPSLTI